MILRNDLPEVTKLIQHFAAVGIVGSWQAGKLQELTVQIPFHGRINSKVKLDELDFGLIQFFYNK